MPKAAQCPSCGGPLSETSVVAVAPVCEHCKAVITETGGTLGLTSAYGVNDPTITRRRVEADLAVFRDYRNKYVGMLEACKEQLTWGVERYAKLPPEPELLPLVDVPPFWKNLLAGLVLGVVLFLAIGVANALVVLLLSIPLLLIYNGEPPWSKTQFEVVNFLMWSAFIVSPVILVFPHFKAVAANGRRPLENARRQREYESARAAALKAAEPVKAAQDHRLRCQIRELEGLIKTITAKADEVRGILRTLR
jgi:hypothetical protein